VSDEVEAALTAAGHQVRTMEMAVDTRTAELAASAAGCQLDQIAKSIIFQAQDTGEIVLFITVGGNRVDASKASALAGQPEQGRC
jgi:prolyl-tRNA editing enzyme YbaK/EbsC (Cys-tRNA(Pro) deacylase)